MTQEHESGHKHPLEIRHAEKQIRQQIARAKRKEALRKIKAVSDAMRNTNRVTALNYECRIS